ncbi:uncharacterized protein LOC144303134 isoform X2 [Canis aureus]
MSCSPSWVEAAVRGTCGGSSDSPARVQGRLELGGPGCQKRRTAGRGRGLPVLDNRGGAGLAWGAGPPCGARASAREGIVAAIRVACRGNSHQTDVLRLQLQKRFRKVEQSLRTGTEILIGE